MALHSIQVEKHFLCGLFQHPEVFNEVEGFISEKAFAVRPHDVIYGVIRSTILANEKLDKVLVAQKIKSLGITFKEDIDIFDYLEAITFAPLTRDAAIDAAKELVKLKALRELDEACTDIQKHLKKSVNEPLSKIITECDSIYGSRVTDFEQVKAPEGLFDDVIELIEERRKNPIKDVGLIWPFADFNKYYGGARGGNIYAIASRPGQGKTTWLNWAAIEMGRINQVPVLILDTEMSTQEIKFRTAAGFSGVPLHIIETGNFLDDKQAETAYKVLRQLKVRNVYHYHVGNKNVDEVCSIIRRWYLKHVGRGNKCVVVYDYLKLTGEKLAGHWAEHQALGEKVDKFKRLSEEFDFPFLTAIQLNRAGENTNRQASEVTDDGSAISQTDRLQWFCTYLGIFRRRTEDEIMLDGFVSGSHKLIEIKARYQGREAAGHQDFLKRKFPDSNKERYIRNFLNFNIQNFAVYEKGSARDSIAYQNAQFQIANPPAVDKSKDTF
jgi:replicative DNA helicase